MNDKKQIMREKGKVDIARGIVDKYTNLGEKHKRGYSKAYIATVLFEENPDVYKDREDARYYVRYVTKSAGVSVRSRTGNVDELLSKRFALISNPTEELPNPEPYIIPKQYKNTLIIADLHSKFYDRSATEIAINYGVKKGCDSVIIDGDFMDYYGFSKFDRSAITMNGFWDEREWGVDMLQLLQECFGRVFLKKGNHDIRRELSHERLAVQFPDVLDLARYSEYLFFDDSNVEIIEDYRHIVYGKANIIHGHEYQGGGGIHVAYNRLNKTMDNTISAHSHTTQSDFRPDINGNLYGSWSIGCLCNLHPRYNPKNRWTQGFARIEKDESGEFEMLNRMIYNGKTIPV